MNLIMKHPWNLWYSRTNKQLTLFFCRNTMLSKCCITPLRWGNKRECFLDPAIDSNSWDFALYHFIYISSYAVLVLPFPDLPLKRIIQKLRKYILSFATHDIEKKTCNGMTIYFYLIHRYICIPSQYEKNWLI